MIAEAETKALSIADIRQLQAHANELRATLGTLALAGLQESNRARELRAEREAVLAVIADAQQAQHAADTERWEQQEAARAAREREEQQREKEKAAAAEWLQTQLAGLPVRESELLEAADGASIGRDALFAAARDLAVTKAQRYGPGGRLPHGQPFYWKQGSFFGAGYAHAEPV